MDKRKLGSKKRNNKKRSIHNVVRELIYLTRFDVKTGVDSKKGEWFSKSRNGAAFQIQIGGKNYFIQIKRTKEAK